jgi:acetolactate synthase small subunit
VNELLQEQIKRSISINKEKEKSFEKFENGIHLVKTRRIENVEIFSRNIIYEVNAEGDKIKQTMDSIDDHLHNMETNMLTLKNDPINVPNEF